MERTYSPLIRQFSAIEGLQAPYTLVYALEPQASEGQCRLSLCRTGDRPRVESLSVNAGPESAYRLLRFLCENTVQPEIWQDVVAEVTACGAVRERNGMLGDE